MDTRKLSLILMLGGAGMCLLALIWFMTAYASAMEMASDFMGDEYVAKMMSCLYSSSPICQGADLLDDSPAYSPVVFWIGVIGLLAGVAIRFAAGKNAVAGLPASDRTGQAPDAGKNGTGEIMGFIPPGQYARYSYILALSGAVAGLILTPLAIVGVAGFVLALLGLTVFRPRLNALDTHHLGLLCLVFAAASLLMLVTRGTFLFVLGALAQVACFYVGFNSYRHGRIVTAQNLKGEFLAALRTGSKPGTPPLSDHERH
jgi:hypothetical protein